MNLALTLLLFGAEIVSHPPLRSLKFPSDAAIGDGPNYFVSPDGDDAAAGSIDAPWKTIEYALTELEPDDTLLLRGGIYRENVRIALRDVVIRGYPNEHAIIDGSIAEFYESPETAWELVDESIGEFRSTSKYPNLRNVLGSFGDSMIGLQTYYHKKDLRAESEVIDWEDWDNRDETDIRPIYLGPGCWYNHEDAKIYIRLAHTNLPEPMPNYKGKTDPRLVPQLLAPFRSTPLTLDGAKGVKIQDLTIRGAGYTAVELYQATDIEFNNVTIWAGAYGIRASGTRGFKMLHCGVYGNVAPWTFRNDGSKRDYPGRPHRNLSRLNTHASFEIEAGRESSVYAFPRNDDWEIGWCEFTDAHDGPYFGAIGGKFHHNLVENVHDDGIYLSPMYKRHPLEHKGPEIHVSHNLFRKVLTPIAFGGPWPETRDQIYIYQNVFELTKAVPTGRPTTQQPEPRFSTGKFMGDHGSPPWPAMNIYHNTILSGDPQRRAAGGAFGGMKANNPRRVFNNLFWHQGRLPGLVAPPPESDFKADGNLYWSSEPGFPEAEVFFRRFRAAFPESSQNSVIADPAEKHEGVKLDVNWPATNDRAIGAGSIKVGRQGRIEH